MARVLAAAVFLGLALGVNGAGAERSVAQKCAFVVRFDGSLYYMWGLRAVAGERVGRGSKIGCNDTGGPPPPDVPADIHRFRTADPRVAVTIRMRGQPDRLAAVSGRCSGFGFDAGYRRCLATEIRFGGRGYSSLRGRAVPLGRALGRGDLRGRPVRLRAAQGIDSRIAVVLPDEPRRLWIAHRRCELGGFDSPLFMRCIRSPLWLDVSPTGSIRTVTVKLPGALVRDVRLRLFLAPDADADAITTPDDERLTPTGLLAVDAQGHGSTKLAIVDSVETGSYAVMAELPGRRMTVVGALFHWKTRRRD
jgi:hypothetical protein